MSEKITLKQAAEALLDGGCSTFTAGAKAMYDGPLGANDEHEFDSRHSIRASDFCREMLRAALVAIRDQNFEPRS